MNTKELVIIINLLLCFIILLLGNLYSKKSKSHLSLFIGISFGLFGITHILNLFFSDFISTIIISILRITGYSLIVYSLVILLKNSLKSQVLIDEGEKLQFLFDVSPEALLLSRLNDGLIVLANDGLCHLSGHTQSEIINQTTNKLNFFTKKNDREEFIKHLNIHKNIRNYEMDFVRKDSKIISCLVSAKIILYKDELFIFSSIRDITDKKQIEEELKLSELKYRKIFENVHDIFFQTDINGKILEISPSISRYIGYTREELVGSMIQNIYLNPEERIQLIQNILVNTELNDYELNFRTKDNKHVIVSLSAHLLKDNQNNIIGLEGSIRDVTDRKKFEEEISKLSKAVEQSPVSIIITDVNGNIEYANRKFSDLTGYSFEEVKGQNPRILNSELLPKEFFKELWDTLLSGNNWFGEFHNKKKNGEHFWEQAYISPIINNKKIITHFIAIKEDITERKKINKLLQERIALYEFANMNSIENVLEKSLNIINELTESKIALYHLVSNDQYNLVLTACSAISKNGNNNITKEEISLKIDNEEIWKKCLVTKKPEIYNEYKITINNNRENPNSLELSRILIVPVIRNEKVVAILSVGNKLNDYNESDTNLVSYFSDISWSIVEKMKRDIELRDLNEQLYSNNQIIEENLFNNNVLLGELQKSEDNLKISNATKDKFFSIIAHDLRNPFVTILNMSELIVNHFEEISDIEKKKIMSNIHQSSKLTYKLLENLLQWSRSQMGIISFEPDEYDLYNIVLNAVLTLNLQASMKKITINNKIEPGTFIKCDNNMIDTVIRNLLSNSIKFCRENDSININVETFSKDKNKVQISIEDSGIGISEENLNKLFELNEKTTSKGTKNEIGTGLGLLICKEFIEKHNGQIWVESIENQGSTFYFTVPKSLRRPN